MSNPEALQAIQQIQEGLERLQRAAPDLYATMNMPNFAPGMNIFGGGVRTPNSTATSTSTTASTTTTPSTSKLQQVFLKEYQFIKTINFRPQPTTRRQFCISTADVIHGQPNGITSPQLSPRREV